MSEKNCLNELYHHIESAFAMLYSGKETQLLKDWLKEVEGYVDDYRQYLEGIEEGMSSRKAWDEIETDLDEFRQGLLELECPDVMADLYHDAERGDKHAPSEFSKEVLDGYASALDEHLSAIEHGLTEILEHATYWH
jgi:hypothetical protein